MIVRNEERNLPECLREIRDLFDEIVIVDTGSTDNTVEVARSLGAKVYHFPWCDDFSAARNEFLKHATGDWIFWLDADDRIERTEAEKLRKLISPAKDTAFFCHLYCYKPDGKDIEGLHLRLFPNLPGIKFEGLVHEQLGGSLQKLGIKLLRSDVKIFHLGYSDKATELKKAKRNLKLLKQGIKKAPEDINVRYHLITHYNLLGDTENALKELKTLLEQVKDREECREVFLVCCTALGNCYRRLGRFNLAIEKYKQALEIDDNYSPAHFFLGELYFKLGRTEEAREELLKADALGIKLGPIFLPIRSIYYYISYYLGRCHEKKGQLGLAIREYHRALQMDPGSTEVYSRLGLIYLQRKQYEKAEKALRKTVEMGSNQALNYWHLGIACFYQNKLNQAKEAFKEFRDRARLNALPSSPRQLEVLANLAYPHLRWDHSPEVERDFLEVMGLAPRFIGLRLGLAKVSAQRGDFLRLHQEYKKIFEIYPELMGEDKLPHDPEQLVRGYEELGRKLISQNRLVEAILALETALITGSPSTGIKRELGDLYMRLGDYPQAKRLYEEVVLDDPGDYAALCRLGNCRLRMGERGAAELCYRRARELMGHKPTTSAALTGRSN